MEHRVLTGRKRGKASADVSGAVLVYISWWSGPLFMKTISYYSACKVTYKASVSGCPLIVGHWLSPFSTRSPCQRHLVVQMTNDTLRLWKPSVSGIWKAVVCRLFSHFAIVFQDWCTNRFKCALIHLCNLSSSGSGGHSLNYYLFIYGGSSIILSQMLLSMRYPIVSGSN